MPQSESIKILDFGSQYTQLIARRLREHHVFSEIVPATIKARNLNRYTTRGIILSGGPQTPDSSTLTFDPDIFELGIPILGICYGMQLMNHLHGGTLTSHHHGEYGKQKVMLQNSSALFHQLNEEEIVWMSHGICINHLAQSFHVMATSKDGVISAIENPARKLFGLQFHPEVEHTTKGNTILDNFLNVCGCSRSWSMSSFIDKAKDEIRNRVKDGIVVSFVSGGVDSTLSTILCIEALKKEQVIPIHVDTGLMRENESREVIELLNNFGINHLVHVQAEEQFLTQLRGVKDPEKKRHIIGNLFVEILNNEIKKMDAGFDSVFLCQGTLYPDLVESGKGCGSNAEVIKSHHNVNPPFIEEKRKKGYLIEPNAELFKDEVRKACLELGVPNSLMDRHPFPGPGLAIRIIGEVTRERVALLRKADYIFVKEIESANLYNKIWQAFCVLIPISTVGVMGDKRKEGAVIALRAVNSSDGMTADCYRMPMELLEKIATRIVNEIDGICRVVYDITSKPPATIEWE